MCAIGEPNRPGSCSRIVLRTLKCIVPVLGRYFTYRPLGGPTALATTVRFEIAGEMNEVVLWARGPLFLVSVFLDFPAFLPTLNPGAAHRPIHQIPTA